MLKIIAVVFPILLLASLANAADVSMRWDASANATGYKIYKSEDQGQTWDSGLDVGNVTSYTYIGVIETGLVLFKISAYNAIGETIRHQDGVWYDHTKIPPEQASGFGAE